MGLAATGGDTVALQLSKPAEDGLIATLLNRKLSGRISKHLARTPISPNTVTLISFAMCIAAAFLFARGTYLLGLIAGLVVQFSSILDGCDGEIARIRQKQSPFGACLDTILDRYADVALVVGITYAYFMRQHELWAVGLALVPLTGFILASYTRKEYQIRHGAPPPAGIIAKLSKRDLRLFGIMLGAIVSHAYVAIIILGIISHFSVIWIFTSHVAVPSVDTSFRGSAPQGHRVNTLK